MTESTYYTDHWRDIEPERIARYERMFSWRDAHAEMLSPLGLEAGHRVLDFGCGPGFVARGIADVVGVAGRVHGVDLNARFVADASRRNESVSHLAFHLATDQRIPLPDSSVDRLLCKNVLEYVPDVAATLAEFRRVLDADGQALVIDSDWAFVVVEPWGRERTERFFAAAAPAFKTPLIGRGLRAALLGAGFEDVQVRVQASADTAGGSLAVLHNMASYAAAFDRMPSDEIDALIHEADAAVARDRYLFCLPQFVVTGRRP